MAKRFTDTEKWERPWFRNLPLEMKCFWVFVTDKCDIAGIWYVDLDLASYLIGKKIKTEDIYRFFGEQIVVLDNGKRWLIKDFANFQYGELKDTNNLHRSVIKRLEDVDISGADQPLTSPWPGAKDKVKDKDNKTTDLNNILDKDKSKENVLGETKIKFSDFVYMTQGQYDQLAKKLGKTVVDSYVERLNNYIGSHGKKYKSHYHTILSWTSKDVDIGVVKPYEERKPPDDDCIDCFGTGLNLAPGSGKNFPCHCTKLKKEKKWAENVLV